MVNEPAIECLVKRFENPDDVIAFELGRFELLRIGGMTIGRATYQPGWKWSRHVGSQTGQSRCQVEHLGLVIAGKAMVVMDDGREQLLKEGDCFSIGPGHDSWVVGDQEYVSLHFLGAEDYARRP